MAFEIADSQAPAASQPSVFSRRLELPAFARSIGVRERMAFTEQLSLLLDTGVSIHEALRLLRQQTADPTVAGILLALSVDVADGQPI